MQRFFVLLLTSISYLCIFAQRQTFSAKVIDAEDGSPLHYATVCVNSEKGAITNQEGVFELEADGNETVCISYVGYSNVECRFRDLPSIVKMNTLSHTLKEVSVLSDFAILAKVENKLKSELNSNLKKTSTYFNRVSMSYGEDRELVEDIICANSVGCLHNVGVFCGRYWAKTQDGNKVQSSLQQTNVHKLITLGPAVHDESFWDFLTLPLSLNGKGKKVASQYCVTHELLENEDGNSMYKIVLKSKKENNTGILTGTLFVDAGTYSPLRFEGVVHGVKLKLTTKLHEIFTVVDMHVHVEYEQNDSITEVRNMSFRMANNDIELHSVLTAIDGYNDSSHNKPVAVKNNLLNAILEAGESEECERFSYAIKRTSDEDLLAVSPAISQGDAAKRILSYMQKAMNYNRTVPQEKVYMHFDNTGYFENETMWFKAYVTRTDKQQLTDLSKVLYVELLNPSGDVLKTTKWPIDSLGQANGDMKLDTLFGSGFYEVRAYTRYMTNWGVNALFSRVFPVFKAPTEEGNYSDLTIKTRLYQHRDPNNRDASDSLYTKAIAEGVYSNELMKTVSVQFYPEGGDLIVGKKCRVAMLAVDDNGRPYQGTGYVENAKGEVVATVETDSLGRGLFEITPDITRFAMQMHNRKNSIKKSTQVFELPVAKTEGCALTMDAINDDMLVTMQNTDALCGRLLGYMVMNNGNITYCDTVVAQPLIEIELDRSVQKPGVNQFTVFDSSGRILAERMYFICPEPSTADSIYFASSVKRLKPCCPVELNVKTLPNATFSFSAIDAKNMTNGKQGNLKTWMLLSSDIKGYIHNVDYYFESDDKEHRKSADMLMLTQGWRRYDWDLMTGRRLFDKIQPIEDKFYLYGKLNEYRKKNPANNVNMETFLFNAQGESLVGKTITDEKGNYAFELPFLDGEWKMQIYTKLNDKKKTYYVGIDRNFSPTPRFISPIEAEIKHPLKPNLFVVNPSEELPEEEEFIPITRKDHVLENVTVKSKRRYFTNDDWRYKNEAYGRQHATLFYDIDRELDNILDQGEAEHTIFEFLCKKNSMFGNPDPTDLPKPKAMPPAGISIEDSEISDLRQAESLSSSGATAKYDDLLWYGHLAYGNRPIKWIVDNGETGHVFVVEPTNIQYVTQVLGSKPTDEIDEPWAMVSSNSGSIGEETFPQWMNEIKSLYIVPNSPREQNNAVRIYMYTHRKTTTASNKGLRRTYFQGFNKPSTFKMEDYSILPPMADFRRTIYWNPNVRTDSEGKARIEFYNNSTCEEMYISAEGMSDDGRVIVNE